ncbi:hypothetical protein HDZ31DRAFT_73365 [Schizophyllum fasciatum]
MKYALLALLFAVTGTLGASVPAARSSEAQAARPACAETCYDQAHIAAPCNPRDRACYCFAADGVANRVGACIVAQCSSNPADLNAALVDASSICTSVSFAGVAAARGLTDAVHRARRLEGKKACQAVSTQAEKVASVWPDT